MEQLHHITLYNVEVFADVFRHRVTYKRQKKMTAARSAMATSKVAQEDSIKGDDESGGLRLPEEVEREEDASLEEDSGSELEVQFVPRDKPDNKAGPRAVAMQERLGDIEKHDEHPQFVGVDTVIDAHSKPLCERCWHRSLRRRLCRSCVRMVCPGCFASEDECFDCHLWPEHGCFPRRLRYRRRDVAEALGRYQGLVKNCSNRDWQRCERKFL